MGVCLFGEALSERVKERDGQIRCGEVGEEARAMP
jgi:hypothetical protein